MATLDEHLRLDRCPHCSIDNPNLTAHVASFLTKDDRGTTNGTWRVYVCKRCGGVVTAYGKANHNNTVELKTTYPKLETVSANIPKRVKDYLQQAIDSTFAPAGSVMLSASAVDAMLKEKGYKEGSLYKRIEKGVEDALLTPEMAVWAHQVRLDANDQRHSDEEVELPTIEDAKQSIEFVKTLAEFLFVLPAKVSRGIEASKASGAVTNPKNSPNTNKP